MQLLFNQAGYATERKNVPQSRGIKKADLHVKDFRLEGIRDVIIDVTLRSEFHGSCIDSPRNGVASYADPNGVIDAAVKAKVDNSRRKSPLILPEVVMTAGRKKCFERRVRLFIMQHAKGTYKTKTLGSLLGSLY